MEKDSCILVVSHYKENLQWLDSIRVPFFIINKDKNEVYNSVDNPLFRGQVKLPNVGRESESMLYFMEEYYELLPERIIFVQGDPFPHQPRILELLTPESISSMPVFLPLTDRYLDHMPTPEARAEGTQNNSHAGVPIYIGHLGEAWENLIPSFFDVGKPGVRNCAIKQMEFQFTQQTTKSLREKLYSVLELEYNKGCLTPCCIGAMFHVHRGLIRNRRREYFTRLRHLNQQSDQWAYIFENMWYAIFHTPNVELPQSSSPKSWEIVVAHMNENLEWLGYFPADRLNIYSKGIDAPDIPGRKYVLPNVGREAHTYLTYIIENYNNLPDIVFFTQGRIPYHIQHRDLVAEYLELSPQRRSSSPSIDPFGNGLYNYRLPEWEGSVLEASNLPGDQWFKTNVDANVNICSPQFCVFWNAVFSVRREPILSRPLNYYKELLKNVNEKINPEAVHYFERSWYYIFNLHKL